MVYALTSSPRVPRLSGLRGEPLRTVRIGRIVALVSDARRAPPPTPANLRRYHEAIGAIAGRLPAILPARFATVMDVSELAFLASSRQQVLCAMLTRVRGRVQMILRVRAGKTSARSRAAAPARAPVSGAAYLRRRAAEVASGQAVPELSEVSEAVARWVRDERVERQGGFVSVYHLVPRGRATAYTRAARDAAAAGGVPVVVSGPYPPYAFVTL